MINTVEERNATIVFLNNLAECFEISRFRKKPSSRVEFINVTPPQLSPIVFLLCG